MNAVFPAKRRDDFKYAVCTWSTPRNNTLQDIEQCARIGAHAVGIWEHKFSDNEDDAIEEALAKHNIRAGIVLPRHWTILATPLDPKGMPIDWQEKCNGICKSIQRLARFNPVGILVGCGVSGDPHRRLGPVDHVVEGLKMVADAAGERGLTICFEPLSLRRGAAVATLPETVDVLDKAKRRNIKILLDMWHCWPEENLHARMRQYVDHIMGIQVNDVRDPERSWCDRVFPGDGRNVCTPMLATLIEAGFNGWYDFEVFSDDGRWGNDFPDSLWKVPHDQFLLRGYQAFEKCFDEANRIVATKRFSR